MPDDDQIKAHLQRPEMKTAVALVEEIASRGPLAAVLVDRALKAGAVAEVYLNAPAPLTRFFVVPEAKFDDEIIDRAIGLAFQYEIQNPNDLGPIKFTLFHGGMYERESASGRFRDRQFFDAVYTSRDLRTNEILRVASKTQGADVPGIGRGKIVSLGRRPDQRP